MTTPRPPRLRLGWLRSAAYLIFLVALAPAHSEGSPIRELWQRRINIPDAPDPIAADLDMDQRLDVIQVSNQGQVLAIDPLDGRIRWAHDFGELSLLTPVTGHLLGRGRINVVVASTEGDLFVLDGPTGMILHHFNTGYPLTLAPAIFPWTQGEASPVFHEGLLLYDAGERRLVGHLLHPCNGLELLFSYALGDALNAPPAVGVTHLEGPPPHVAYVTGQGRVGVFSARQPEISATTSLNNGSRTDKGILLADINGDELMELIVADRAGYLHAMTPTYSGMHPAWLDTATRQRIWHRSIRSEPTEPPVAIDVDGDGCDEVLLPRRHGFLLVQGRSGMSFWEPERPFADYSHPTNLTSPPAVFKGADGRSYVVFADNDRQVTLLDLLDRRVAGQFRLRHIAVATPIVGPLRGEAAADIFIRTNLDGFCYLLDPGLSFLRDSAPWLGLRGGATRAGSPSSYERRFKAAQTLLFADRIEERLAHARALAEAGHWGWARQAAGDLLEGFPLHSEARRLYWLYLAREQIILLLLSGTCLALAGGWGGIRLGRRGWLRLLHARARRAQAEGNLELASHSYDRLCRIDPERAQLWSEAASIVLQRESYDAAGTKVLEQAHKFHPQDERYLRALAAAYAAADRMDESAARIYQEMARRDSRPDDWWRLLGRAYIALGRPHEALEALRKVANPDRELAVLMTDLYIELEESGPEILPTLEQALEQRHEELGFLRIYCQACQRAGRHDELAAKMACQLLECDPASPSAHLILSMRALRSGDHAAAGDHASRALQTQPREPLGLRLLGSCYAAQGRLDVSAMKVYARALELNPDAPELLLAVARGHAQAGRTDPAARRIYEQALAHDSADQVVLTQLAQVAAAEGDDALAIRSLEPLLALGRLEDEHLAQLAEAWSRTGMVEDKAEPIYREALRRRPDHVGIQEALAAIWLRRGRHDQEAALLFETIYERQQDRVELGLALARCWQEGDQPERAFELCAQLRRRWPDNLELIKLEAAASQRADQVDSALAGYMAVLAERPDDEDAIVALSLIHGRRRAADDPALKLYEQAIQLRPTEPEHYLAAARAYAGREGWERVIEICRLLLARRPDRLAEVIDLLEAQVEQAPLVSVVRLYLVDMLIFAGRLVDARRHMTVLAGHDPKQGGAVLAGFERILEKTPEDALVWLEKGRLLIARGQLAEAREALEQAHRLQPNHSEIVLTLMDLCEKLLARRESTETRFLLGRLAMQAQRHELAIACFQQTGRDFRWERDSERNLARCFMARGMLDMATAKLRRQPLDDELKGLLYDLGLRYEAIGDPTGARDAFKLIYAGDIEYRDVRRRLERLVETNALSGAGDRSAIRNSLSEKAKARYELGEELGRGSMGIVYKAHDQELDESVALKILPEGLMRNPEALRRFRQEARNARRLTHPHIVRIHDIGEEQGRKYISMEYIDGGDLKKALRQASGGRLPLERVLRYARQICEAMACAHAEGIVHRDIKPANLMLTHDDRIKVTDFGIAKTIQEEAPQPEATGQGAVVGTPLYMSPEQVRGGAVDHRADIYSIGVVLYELLVGRPPFFDGDLSYQHMFVEPKPPADCPVAVSDLVMRCLAKDPDGRWASAEQLLAELDRIAATAIAAP